MALGSHGGGSKEDKDLHVGSIIRSNQRFRAQWSLLPPRECENSLQGFPDHCACLSFPSSQRTVSRWCPKKSGDVCTRLSQQETSSCKSAWAKYLGEGRQGDMGEREKEAGGSFSLTTNFYWPLHPCAATVKAAGWQRMTRKQPGWSTHPGACPRDGGGRGTRVPRSAAGAPVPIERLPGGVHSASAFALLSGLFQGSFCSPRRVSTCPIRRGNRRGGQFCCPSQVFLVFSFVRLWSKTQVE